MDENSQKKTRNQEFLRQLDAQRLNKTCNLPIDLRGHVPGECQAYTFGGLTHYLDDRAYLVAKQLLDRFDGRYTFGVNQALLTTIKSLNSELENDSSATGPQQSKVQIITFDHLLRRKEPRIIFSTPIEIRIADVLYHANTIDITTSAIRVALKRAFTLKEGETIITNFPEFIDSSQPILLLTVNYTIFKIEHDAQHTIAILTRNRNDDADVTTWFDNWSQAHNLPENLDVDGELYNLASHYYLRLFCTTMSSPLFWLASLPNEDPVRVFNLSSIPQAHSALSPLTAADQNIDFSLLPIEQIVKEQRDCLIFIYQYDDNLQNFVIPRHDKQLIGEALAWHCQQPNSHVLLMLVHPLLSVSNDGIEQLPDILDDTNDDSVQALPDRLESLSTLATLTNITDSCQHLAPHNEADNSALLALTDSKRWSGSTPDPTSLRHYIDRKNQRFFIRTDVSIQLANQTFSVTTHDVSETGLSLYLPGIIDFPIGTRVHINFIRWHSGTKKTKLDAVPFTIKKVQFWQQSTFLGLERHVLACAESINKFFVNNMERNKEQLAKDSNDTQTTQETKFLAPLVVKQLTTIPFYLGTDSSSHQRVLQAVASTQNNHAEHLTDLLQAMSGLVAQMTGLLTKVADKSENSVCFGLYCYRDQEDNSWQFTTDVDFSAASQKELFINKAFLGEQYHFFHCTLTPIKLSLVEQEADLNQQLAQFRHQVLHKTTQLRKTLHNLYAIGELTDITDIIEAAYR